MLYTMIVLAYCVGLRFGEIVRLRMSIRTRITSRLVVQFALLSWFCRYLEISIRRQEPCRLYGWSEHEDHLEPNLACSAVKIDVAQETRLMCDMMRGPTMVAWRILRSVVAVFLLLLATTEILACDAIASPACPFSAHSSDNSDGCGADGCLCCCGHIVVVAPIVPIVPLGYVAPAVTFDARPTPDVPLNRIEHPPRS